MWDSVGSTIRPARMSRAFVAAGVIWFVVWQGLVFAGSDRSTAVVAGVYGFVFHVVFGKGYALIPSYFERELALPRAPAAQFPLTVLGTVFLLADVTAAIVGIGLWAAGAIVFVGALLFTMGRNVTGRETGTGASKTERRRVDRLANAFVPIVLAYLLLATVAPIVQLRSFQVLAAPAVSHLLAVGAATLLVFAIGFRLFPRFLVVEPHPAAPAIVLPAGAIGPGLLAWDFLGGVLFHTGALLIAIAVVGFALGYGDMFRRSARRRIGFHVVSIGVLFGVVAVGLALYLAFIDLEARIIHAHVRLGTLGFLGLVIVGVTYQFYPPSIGAVPGVGDRFAGLAVGLLATGIAIESGGSVLGVAGAIDVGQLLALLGSLAYAYVILGLFAQRR